MLCGNKKIIALLQHNGYWTLTEIVMLEYVSITSAFQFFIVFTSYLKQLKISIFIILS